MAESQGPVVQSVAITFLITSTLTISLRLYSRYVLKRLGVDDWLMCIAMLMSLAFIICNLVAVSHGLGDHIENVQGRGISNMISYLQIIWLSSIFYNLCLGFIKFSVLWLYRRLLSQSNSLMRMIPTTMFVICIAQTFANVLLCIFQCDPVYSTWDITISEDEKDCININSFYKYSAIANITTDFVAYIMPIPTILGLNMPVRQKVIAAGMLCLGLFSCISSIIRFTTVLPMLRSSDATWVIAKPMYWSVIETNVGIFAASMPSLKTLARLYAPCVLDKAEPVCSGFRELSRSRSNDLELGNMRHENHINRPEENVGSKENLFTGLRIQGG